MKKLRRRSSRSLVSRHPDRSAIEAALARQVPLRRLEKRFGLSIHSLSRHRIAMRRDLPEVFAALAANDFKVRPEELAALRDESADGFLKALRALIAKITAACDRAIEEGNDRVASSYANNIINAMRLLSEVVKLIGDASTVQINNAVILTSPAFHEIRTAIIGALSAHPEARAAVIRALRERLAGGLAEAAENAPPMLTLPASSAAGAHV